MLKVVGATFSLVASLALVPQRASAVQFDILFDKSPSLSASSPSQPYNPAYQVGSGYIRFDQSLPADGDYAIDQLSNLAFKFQVSPAVLTDKDTLLKSSNLRLRVYNGGQNALFWGTQVQGVFDLGSSSSIQFSPSLAAYSDPAGPYASAAWIGFQPYAASPTSDPSYWNNFPNKYSSSAFSSLTSNNGYWDQQVGSYTMVRHAEPVPAPLPILGAVAALGFSRNLRRRFRTVSSRPQACLR